MSQTYYCPTCKKEVERLMACGATSYFCNHCKTLVSSKTVLTEEEAKACSDEKESR